MLYFDILGAELLLSSPELLNRIIHTKFVLTLTKYDNHPLKSW